MGQNFLIDQHVLQTIVSSGNLTATDRVIEVGPGLGVLTWELLQQTGQVLAVELDKRLVARLREEFADAPQLQVIQGDILKLPPADVLGQAGLSPESPYKVVANLPYAITSPVLRHFLEATHKPNLLVILIQWEVAQRITAPAGNLSVLAHSVQIYAQPEIVARVPAGSFFPQPAVDSAILRLQVYPTPAVAVDSIDALFRVIKAGFLQPRKKLSNALPGGLAAMGQRIPRETAVAALEAAGVAPERRAETVTLEEWARVYTALRDG
jgi:16S rRNA (adenine1518-N6/adenine1519-N6)-dimethyltransferase